MSEILYRLVIKDNASPALESVASNADDAAEGLEDVTVASGATSTSLGKMRRAGAAAAAMFATLAAGATAALGKSTVALASDLERAETQLTVLTGSSSFAKNRIEELFKLTTKTPFLFPDLVEAEVKLTSFGANAEQMLPLVMNAAAALGTDLSGAAHAVGKAFGAGASGAEALRERMPKVFALMNEGLKGTTGDLQAFQEALVNALQDETFEGGTERLTQTFAGAVSNLQGQWTEFQLAVSKAGLFDAVRNTVIATNEQIDLMQEKVNATGNTIGSSLTRAWFETLSILGHILDILDTTAAVIKTVVGGAVNTVALAFHALFTAVLETVALIAKIIPGESEFSKSLQGLKRQNRAFFKENAQAAKDSFVKPLSEAMGRNFSETISAVVDEARLKTKQGSEADALERGLGGGDGSGGGGGGAVDMNAAVDAFEHALSVAATKPLEEAIPLIREHLDVASSIQGFIDPKKLELEYAKLEKMERRLADQKLKAAQDEIKAAQKLAEAARQAALEAEKARIALVTSLGDALSSVVSGGISSITSLLDMLGPKGAAVSSFVAAFHALGEKGAEQVAADLQQTLDVLMSGIEQLPDLLTEALPEVMSSLVAGFIERAPDIALALGQALLLAMPTMMLGVAEGLFNGLVALFDRLMSALGLGEQGRSNVATAGRVAMGVGTLGLSEVIRFLAQADSFQTGGYVDRTGMALVHAGEHITPAGGVPTADAARMGARGTNSGANVTINTSVVDPNTIPALVREIERVFGTNGRGTSPLFA